MDNHNGQQLDQWYQTTTGRALLSAERQAVQRALADIRGHYWLQLSTVETTQWLTQTPGGTLFYAHPVTTQSHHGHCVQTTFAELALLTDSVDVLLLPHVLASSAHPQAILAECFRALVPDGILVILSFNPLSLWRLSLLGRRPAGLKSAKTVTRIKLMHWLKQSQLTLLSHKTVYFRPYARSSKLLDGLLALEAIGQLCWPLMGASHVIIAQKQVVPLTPTGEALRARVAMPQNHCAQPTTRVRTSYEN